MSIHTAKEQVSGLATFSFNDDSNTGLHSSAADTVSLLAGGVAVVGGTATTATLGVATAGGLSLSATSTTPRVSKIAITGSTVTASSLASLACPSSTGGLITRVDLYFTTPSTGAATLDIGVATTAAGSSDIILDGLDVVATTGVVAGDVRSSVNATDDGTNGAMLQGRPTYWDAAKFITVTGSASTAGLAAAAYVTWYPL